MRLNYAIDELYATGWSPLYSPAAERSPDGRRYPSVQEVAAEFAAAGVGFRVREVEEFGCFRAAWGGEGDASGAQGQVVGQSPDEASVYALAHLRRALMAPAGA